MGPETLLFEALIPSLEEVGARFERGDFFVPEMLIAGRAMAGALEVLRPLLAETGAETIGTFVMGTVKGDVHDIGKNLVNIMLEGAGFEVIDLGVQVAPEKFVEAIAEHQPDIVGFSAFLTTTMPMFKANINALEKAGLRDQVIVMVGGAPVTQEYADAVGADGYAADASAAVVRAKELLQRPPRRWPRLSGGRERDGDRAALGDQGGRDRPGAAVLPHRRADQPDRAQDLPGAAARRRPVPDRDRRGRSRSRAAPRCSTSTWACRWPTRPSCWPRPSGWSRTLTDLPLCIDSSVVEALEAGPRRLPGQGAGQLDHRRGRPDGGDPAAGARYGAAVIALPNDEDEIPMEPAAPARAGPRRSSTSRPASTASPLEDIVIDPLAMPIGADTSLVAATLETIAAAADEFGVNMTLGASNVSFGMPDRHALGAAFLPMAMSRRPDQRDHGRPVARRSSRAVKAADLLLEPRRVGRGLDRGAPGPAGGRAAAAGRGSDRMTEATAAPG